METGRRKVKKGKKNKNMKNLPDLKFFVSQNKDFKVYQIFSKQAEIFGVKDDSNRFFYKIHLQLRKINLIDISVRRKNELIKSYIKETYLKESVKIKKGVENAKRQWKEIEKPFFKEVSEIFNNHPWPKGKYVAYPTIWGIYPRFIKDKTFYSLVLIKIKILLLLLLCTKCFILYSMITRSENILRFLRI